ncbi:MAG: hypothetical protein J6B24_00865 [Clostridia bacterium]|nr:hypothetical protein [Clostridia bacterium]
MEALFSAITIIERFGIWGIIFLAAVWFIRIINAQRCQLRSEMLHIYYKHLDKKEIRQYEFENFIHLYKAYRALLGNSFVKKIYDEVITWKVVT